MEAGPTNNWKPHFVPYDVACPARLMRWMSTRWRGKHNLSNPCSHFPQGIARRCDWTVVMHGQKTKQGSKGMELRVYGSASRQPRHVFVRAEKWVLERFFARVLPLISNTTRFVLLTGDSDMTVPKQVDSRYPSYVGTELGRQLDALRTDPRLVHWFAENLDTAGLPKMSPLPIGLIEPRPELDRVAMSPPVRRSCSVPGGPRCPPARALCVARLPPVMRPQWMDRQDVQKLCRGPWAGFTSTSATRRGDAGGKVDLISSEQWVATLARHEFTLCVHGGGLSPNPKAWEALLAGSIPILARDPEGMGSLTEVFEGLPVAWVTRWSADALSPTKLQAWLNELRPAFEQPEKRAEVLKRLSREYWWQKVEAMANKGGGGGSEGIAKTGVEGSGGGGETEDEAKKARRRRKLERMARMAKGGGDGGSEDEARAGTNKKREKDAQAEEQPSTVAAAAAAAAASNSPGTWSQDLEAKARRRKEKQRRKLEREKVLSKQRTGRSASEGSPAAVHVHTGRSAPEGALAANSGK